MRICLALLFSTCAWLQGHAQVVYFNNTYPNQDGLHVQCGNLIVNEALDCYEIFEATANAGTHQLIRKRIDFDGNYIDETSIFFGDTIITWGLTDGFIYSDDGYLLPGFYSPGGIVEKYNDNFDRQWRLELLNTDTSSAQYHVTIKSDNALFCVGRLSIENDETIGVDDVPTFIDKISNEGTLIWRKLIEDDLFGVSIQNAYAVSNGDLILSGITYNVEFDAIVLRTDSLGNLLWYDTFESDPEGEEYDDLWCQSVMIDDSTLVFCYGYGIGNSTPNNPFGESVRNLHLVKYNINNQEIIWEKEFDDIYGTYHYPQDIEITGDSGFVAVGHMIHDPLYWPLDSLQYYYGFSYIMKADEQGEMQWKRKYTYSQDTTSYYGDMNQLYDVELAPDGGYVACGYLVDEDLDPAAQSWVIKVDEYGCLEPGCQDVAVDEIRLDMQGAMSVFPNPVGSVCTVEFNLSDKQIASASTHTELVLTDASGKHLQNLSLPPMGLQHQLQVDMDGYASGVYQLHWVSGNVLLDSVQVVRE